ncbi:transaldolase family protein, partial [Clostridioides difficile]|uniref:transaldolase family protein n=1 Tax=Clostridioides difficile TaxID=1496 RepID=UPI003F8D7424
MTVGNMILKILLFFIIINPYLLPQDGLRAIKDLHRKGIKITATAIFTAHQGFLAAKAGANYIAP